MENNESQENYKKDNVMRERNKYGIIQGRSSRY